MENLSEILTLSVEKAAGKLLTHFQSQYGSLIFLPLGVNSSTPKKIAPAIAESLSNTLIEKTEEGYTLLIIDEKVGQVFDCFINSFFSSLNFIAKGIMKGLGMKLVWNDFSNELAKTKISNPATYEKWKWNLMLVLQEVFEQVVSDLNNGGQKVQLSNGEQAFGNTKEALDALKIFQ